MDKQVLSPWAAAASNTLADKELTPLYTKVYEEFNFQACLTGDSLWIVVSWPKGGRVAFRTAYAPGGGMKVNHITQNGEGVSFSLNAVMGDFSVKVMFPEKGNQVLRYTTALKPSTDLVVPFWPRDIIIPGKNGNMANNTAGKIYVSQTGTRSGLLYFSLTKPKAGTVMYLQNLTALSDYCQQTETSCAEVVGGQWPELGFSLPAAEKPLTANKEVIISDAVVVFSATVPDKEPEMIRQYLELLAEVYLNLPRPETKYHDWPDVLDKGLADLIDNPGCWSQVAGHAYLNAYVSDYTTPPEIMVQLAVLLPLLDYVEWSGASLDIMKTIKAGLPAFYDKKLGTISRWLPAAEDKLEGEEEQKKPGVMDSWYLHHPLLNLSRMALKGDDMARQLFLDSLDYAIKVAHHFNYQWPVFYKMDTLEVIKGETEPGKGGEKDVAGIYAHVLLQAWELTGKKRYLQEAEKAAKTLQGMGFDLFYQANNTAFSAGAMLRLYKLTKNKTYLEISYLCIANILKNTRLWDCNYGYGQHFPSFFALFPLSNAPYTAVYEEQEVFCALHDYLKYAEGEEILPAVSLLIAEYIRYLVDRAIYYYPAMLPAEMLATEIKVGELDPKLWIALEDMHDGWEKCGEVGQEVYGAGNAFGILPRHYLKVPDENFMVFVDYPTAGFSCRKGRPISFTVKGDRRLDCRLVIVARDNQKLPQFTVTVKNKKEEIAGNLHKDGHLEYDLHGDQAVRISWK